jgi:hypothetical protein
MLDFAWRSASLRSHRPNLSVCRTSTEERLYPTGYAGQGPRIWLVAGGAERRAACDPLGEPHAPRASRRLCERKSGLSQIGHAAVHARDCGLSEADNILIFDRATHDGRIVVSATRPCRSLGTNIYEATLRKVLTGEL